MAGEFLKKLETIIDTNNSLVCVGLDVDPDRLPACVQDKPDPILTFTRAIIEATKEHVCAYKVNIAFYEAVGPDGLRQCKETLDSIPSSVVKILDAKRGDIGNTARMYARSCFDYYGADAVTASPYLGGDSLQPFLEYEDRCTFILCLTSNPGSRDFQYLSDGDTPLYHHVARKVNEWNVNENCGLVVGATHPEELKQVRELAPDLPFLIPGIGAQGGDVEKTIQFGTDSRGGNALINSSRGIIFASAEDDYAEAAAGKASELKETINQWRRQS